MPVAARGNYTSEGWDRRDVPDAWRDPTAGTMHQHPPSRDWADPRQQSTRDWEGHGAMDTRAPHAQHNSWDRANDQQWEMYRNYERNLPPRPDPQRDPNYRQPHGGYGGAPPQTQGVDPRLAAGGGGGIRGAPEYSSPQRERPPAATPPDAVDNTAQRQPMYPRAPTTRDEQIQQQPQQLVLSRESQPPPPPCEPQRHHRGGDCRRSGQQQDKPDAYQQPHPSQHPHNPQHPVQPPSPPRDLVHQAHQEHTLSAQHYAHQQPQQDQRGGGGPGVAQTQGGAPPTHHATDARYQQQQQTRDQSQQNRQRQQDSSYRNVRSNSPREKVRHAAPCTRAGHEQYLCDIYCSKTDQHICLLCLRRDEVHKLHKCAAIQPASSEMRASVASWLGAATAQKKELQRIGTTLETAIVSLQQNSDGEITRLEDSIDDLKRRLDIAKKQLTDMARKDTAEEVERLHGLKKDVAQYASKIDETMGEVQKLNSNSSVAELVHLKKFISLTAFQKDEQVIPCPKVRFKAHSAVHTDKLFDIGQDTEQITLPACRNEMNAVIENEIVLTGVDYGLYKC
eukprot:TRINITY_DN112310_c0_g1_i1.p1 TRINITY_DN112310_c0_g1~~TRINITY_DN112310_c0_g1_i1.p1  ORF type:complete len:564 (+),score=68.76 TRINITY_DN112310_c0_g1_i1:30-1721(+)